MKTALSTLGGLLAVGCLSAAIPVPSNLRNPFEIPDPAGFRAVQAPTRADPKDEAAKRAQTLQNSRDALFSRVIAKLQSLQVNGVIVNPDDPALSTVLLGKYIVKQGARLPAKDFGIEGIVLIDAIEPTTLSVTVSIELETRHVTLPLR